MRPASPPPARLLAALAFLGACAGGSSSPYPDRATLPSLEVPYHLPTERCGDYFVVDAVIDGAGPFPLLLDSGAGQTLLDPSVVEATGAGGRIDSLRVGEFAAYGFDYDRLDMERLSSALGRDISGILGHPVFAGVLSTWDFPAGRILLQAGSLPESGEGIVSTRRDRRPFVGSIVQSDTLWILIDTGSSRGLTLIDPARFDHLTRPEVTGARARVDGMHMVESGRLTGEVRLGPIRVDRPVVSNSVSVDLVGQEVLRYFRITFDQAADRIRFERPDTALDVPVPSRPVRAPGFAVDPDATGANVIHVAPEAAGSGLRPGDRVIAVNGIPWSERGCPDPTVEIRADTARLEVVRGSDTLRIAVPSRVVHTLPDPAGIR